MLGGIEELEHEADRRETLRKRFAEETSKYPIYKYAGDNRLVEFPKETRSDVLGLLRGVYEQKIEDVALELRSQMRQDLHSLLGFMSQKTFANNYPTQDEITHAKEQAKDFFIEYTKRLFDVRGELRDIFIFMRNENFD